MGYANEYEDNEIERSWDFGIGIGYGNSTNPFAGSDSIPSYLTIDFSIYGDRFFFDNGDLGFTLIDKSHYSINIIATYNSERIYYSYLNDVGISVNNAGNDVLSVVSSTPIERIDPNTIPTIDPSVVIPSPLPPGINFFPLGDFLLPFEIPDRDFSLNLGTEIILSNKFGSISYQITKDIISVHSGTDMILDFNKSWSTGRWSFAANTGLHWKSNELVDYYYGVDYSFQSIVALQYKGKSSTDWFAGFRANYRLTNNLSLVTSYKFNGFGSAIRNSPIINDSNKQVIFTGLFYRF